MLTGTLEVYVLPGAALTNTLIGLIEEGGKALLVVSLGPGGDGWRLSWPATESGPAARRD
jgi:hypothetical protein